MKIVDHKLHHDSGEPLPFKESPNQRSGLDAKYLIIHYTAGSSAESSIRALTDRTRKVSAIWSSGGTARSPSSSPLTASPGMPAGAAGTGSSASTSTRSASSSTMPES